MTTRERLDVDVLVVGGGPAGLAAALRLSQLQQAQGGAPLSIAVLEKGREPGAHSLSGAVLDPSALAALIPDFVAKGAPLATPVTRDQVLFLTEHGRFRFPVVPPPLRNHGHYIVSLSALVKWLAAQAEAGGVDLFTGFAGQEVLFDGDRVIGVRTGDRGVDRHGGHTPQFEAGVDIIAAVTIFADGARGHLTKQLLAHVPILTAEREPAQYALGIKELWDVPAGRVEAGSVFHTLGYPLRQEEFGGGFIYAMPEGRLAVGLVVGLDYRDPRFDPHMAFNRFKQHPAIATLLDGGSVVRYGAKALPEGGWNAIPRPYLAGGLIAGDAAGFLNSLRLKGIHLAMRTGMLAAEAAFAAVRSGDTSAAGLASYAAAIDAGEVRRELYPVRNVHQAFSYGLVPGLLFSGLSLLTGGRWFQDLHGHAGHLRLRTLQWYYGLPLDADAASNRTTADRRLTFDKVTNVHFSGTVHAEDQPSHLIVRTDICSSVCGPEFGHPCMKFCPANVYEIVRDPGAPPRLHINASNCVHCKTCDIMDPYQAINWVAPEGGDGPQYTGM
jgi:electron-transferring-flavoprotein dehydrogenase